MKKIISVVMCLICMGLIYYMSSDSSSASHSKSYSIVGLLEGKSPQAILNTVNSNTKTNNKSKETNELNVYVRKSAHIIEFFLLSICFANVMFAFNIKGRNAVIYILFFCLFYAVLDEYHQLLTGDRTSRVDDVLIDFAGSVLGMATFYLFYYVRT